MSTVHPSRVAIVTSHPIQYQGPLFRALANHPEVDLTVFFCCDHGQTPTFDREFKTTFAWSRPVTDGFRHEFLPSIHPRPGPYSFLQLINPGLWNRLHRRNFDVLVLLGWGFASCWIALAAARAHGLRVLLRAESGLDSYQPRSFTRSLARTGVLSLLFDNVDAFLSIGTHNEDLYRSFGIPSSRIFLTPYAVDNAYFSNQAARVAPHRAELRRKLGVHDERPLVLTSGKLTERKAPLDLVAAFARVRKETPSKLVFLGDGPLREAVERNAASAKIRDDVLVTGFRDQTELPEVYAAADVFVFPTHFETWGLVANEAMLFGLPVVCTDRVPAHRDLIRSGVTGEVYPAGNVDALASVLGNLLRQPTRLKEMGQRARAAIDNWSIDRGVQGVVDALRSLR